MIRHGTEAFYCFGIETRIYLGRIRKYPHSHDEDKLLKRENEGKSLGDIQITMQLGQRLDFFKTFFHVAISNCLI